MLSIQIRPFQRADREQLTKLVNAHIAAVLPGVSVSVNTVMSQLEREPAEPIVDPWVSERRTLVASEKDAIVAGAHLLRYAPDERVSDSYRDAGEIRWLVARPAATGASDALLGACVEVMDGWRVARQYADGSLPSLATYGVPACWPHIRDLYTRAGFVCDGRVEIILVAFVDQLPAAFRAARGWPGAAPKRRRLRDAVLCRPRRDGCGDDRSRERRDRWRHAISPARLERHRQPPRDRATPPQWSRNMASRARGGLAASRQGRAAHRLRRPRATRRARLPRHGRVSRADPHRAGLDIWQAVVVTTDAPRVIGMLGGMSWQSSAEYYRLANELVRERLGGLHSARCVLASVDFADVEGLQAAGRWDEAGRLLADAAKGLEAAGAELLLLCTNTMHKVADQVQAAVSIPLLHLADATAQAVSRAGLTRVGLLGTRSPWSKTSTETGLPAAASPCWSHPPTTGPRYTGSSMRSYASA